jgi:two-component system chemotaxis sensor kinase CheA
MSAEMDMTQYLDLFLQEAEEQLEILETETLKLEVDPSKDRLQVIFRAAHTLKGSSRAMGFTNMAELTHEMENVLDQLRNDALELSTDIANALLACLDNLVAMTDSLRAGTGDAIECGALVQELKGFITTATPTSASADSAVELEFPADVVETLNLVAEQGNVYRAKFTLHADCVMKYVRVFMITSLIEECGELLACAPSRELLEEEQFDHTFSLAFQCTSELESIKTKFAGISDVEHFDVASWNPTEPAKPQETVADGPISEAEPPVILSKPAPADNVAPTPAPAPAAASNAPKTETGQTVRVDVARLDALMNLVGELVIDRTRIARIGADLSAKYADSGVDALAELVGHLARITGELQDQIMRARMMPIETVFNRFPRVIRDLAQKLGKTIHLELSGGDTELDRSVIEVIGDPLLHILRNSADHGLEMSEDRIKAGKSADGTIRLSARHEENHIVIEINDDGRGIDVDVIRAKAVERGLVSADGAASMSDRDVLQFIFSSGFSTAAAVSEVSGRGVGMDIVRSNLSKLGGLIDLETWRGQGTRFTLRLPLTLAIIRGLLVSVENVCYVVPLGSVIETLLISLREVQRVNQRDVVVIRGMTTPLVRLSTIFGLQPPATPNEDDLYVVVVGVGEKRFGLVVDRLIGEQEVVIKSLSRHCGDTMGVSGATILGDGNVALILDVNGLVNKNV